MFKLGLSRELLHIICTGKMDLFIATHIGVGEIVGEEVSKSMFFKYLGFVAEHKYSLMSS